WARSHVIRRLAYRLSHIDQNAADSNHRDEDFYYIAAGIAGRGDTERPARAEQPAGPRRQRGLVAVAAAAGPATIDGEATRVDGGDTEPAPAGDPEADAAEPSHF